MADRPDTTEAVEETVVEAPEHSPGSSEDGRVDDLERRVAELEEERDRRVADLQRVAADFDNYRKRAARDQEALVARAHERLVQKLLPIVDDLERALEVADHAGVGPGDVSSLQEGVRLVHRELSETLAREGLVEIETNGKFDPHVHEALLSQPSEADEGAIVQVLQKGYRLGDRVVRPARVVISKGMPEPEEASEAR
jgi:molecular chaperone GrpE